jgi:peptide/nickel transport system substrate-binding protein
MCNLFQDKNSFTFDAMQYIKYFVVVMVLFSGCKCNNEKKQNLKVFRYNQASGITSLDPAFSKDQATIWACNQLYNSLVSLDSNLNIVPAIAHSWYVSEDGKTYTFHLRNDVFFHNNECFETGKGRSVVAQDVAYSYQRIIDAKVASPGAWIFNGKLNVDSAFIALNDSTFQLKLSNPFPPILGILSMQYCSVIPKEAVEKYGSEFRANPVGTGPFKFKNWVEGNALVLLKNENYFEQDAAGNKLPYIDGIKVSFMDNKKTEFLSFKQKELDFISGIDAAYIDEVLEENGDLKASLKNTIVLHKVSYLNTEYLGFYVKGNDEKQNPFVNKYLRQALNYAIDRRELIRYLRNGVGHPAEQGFVPRGLPSFDENTKGYTYNAEAAKKLLKQANYNGQELKLYTNETYKDMALLVAKQLESVGVKAKVELSQPSILREWMSTGKVQWFRGSWLADYPDAENYFAVFYSGNDAPPNYTRFANKEFDRLYVAASSKTDEAKRWELYKKMDAIIIDEAPVIPLYYDEVLRFVQPGIKGLSNNAQNLLDLRRVNLQ